MMLTDDDHDLLDVFIERMLSLHRREELSLIGARTHIMHVIAAIDKQSPEAMQYVSAIQAQRNAELSDEDEKLIASQQRVGAPGA